MLKKRGKWKDKRLENGQDMVANGGCSQERPEVPLTELGWGGAWCGPEPCCTHHGKEVVIAFDLGRHLGELLVKCIGDVVGWVSGDDQNTLPPLGQLDC